MINLDSPYVVAEVGGNHGGELSTAKLYVREAADTGVDAVKFQLFQAEYLLERDLPLLPGAGTDHESQFDRYKELELKRSEWEELVELCRELDVTFAASVFDREMADYAAEVCPFIKIASGDVTNHVLLRHVSSLNKPVVLSTGYATMPEIEAAVGILGDTQTVLLHCVGSYPTPPEEANLQMISRLADKFNVPIGYSDHTTGITAAEVALANGAQFIEKHFTLSKESDVGDHGLSATPSEMKMITEAAKTIPDLFSNKSRAEDPFDVELDRRKRMRRSLATRVALSIGETITESKLTALRPEGGISPTDLDDVIGRKVTTDLDQGQLLYETDLE